MARGGLRDREASGGRWRSKKTAAELPGATAGLLGGDQDGGEGLGRPKGSCFVGESLALCSSVSRAGKKMLGAALVREALGKTWCAVQKFGSEKKRGSAALTWAAWRRLAGCGAEGRVKEKSGAVVARLARSKKKSTASARGEKELVDTGQSIQHGPTARTSCVAREDVA